jgi:tetratricopeptide (TPR) repeat protein
MPKRDVGFIAHSALTNHRILRRVEDPLPGAAFSQVSPDLPDLVYFNRAPGQSAALFTLLQAYGELVEKHPPYYERFQALLNRAGIELPENPLVLASLGRRALRSNDIPLAITRLRQAIDKGSESSTTFEDLGEALARSGQLEEAVGVLRRGIELAPFTPVLYKSLVVRYIKLQRYDAAKQTLIRYVELFPEDDFMRKMLAQVSGRR